MREHLETSYRLARLAWTAYKAKGWLALVGQILLPAGVGLAMGNWLFNGLLGPIVAMTAFVILSFPIIGWVFQKRNIEFDSDRFERLFYGAKLVPLGAVANTIALKNREFSEDEVRHDLLRGIWRGDFEDEFGQTHLFLPSAPGIVLWNGEWMPSDGHGQVIGRPTLMEFRRKDLLAVWGSSLGGLRPKPKELSDFSEYEVNQLVDFEVIESLKPSQYDRTDLSAYFDPMLVPNWMFVRWFVKWKKGDYGTQISKSRSITPNFAVERRQIAGTEIATLTADEKAALRQMLITGRPKNLSDQIWQSLEMKTSFVERDFTGPKGIKNEFRPALEEIPTGMTLESRTGALFDVIPRVAGNDAEICVRNLSMDTTLQDVEVSMPNYSETADVYIPEDIFRTLGSRDRLKCPLNINPGDQKYFRFASVTKKNGKDSIRLHYDLKGQKYVTGDECVVKFRVSARDHRAQLLYQHVKIDSNGKLSLSAYLRKKDT